MSERTIYILLTRSGTWFSRLIHFATRDNYTHASIGLDGPDGPFYSFARKYRYLALPAAGHGTSPGGSLLPVRPEGGGGGLPPPAAEAALYVCPAGGLPLQRAGRLRMLL